jgi:hypothetical protein
MGNFIRTLVFVVFFSIAAASLSVSVLCGDLVRYYQSKHLLKEARQSLEQLKSLNADYDALLNSIDKNPNLIKRIAPVTLGVEPGDANAIYPRVSAKDGVADLRAARKALAEDPNRPKTEPPIPQWLARCSKPRQRAALFLISAALIVVSFVCFGPVKQAPKKQDRLPES